MPESVVRYCVIGVYWAHSPDSVQILAIDDKPIVFDTKQVAAGMLQRLGGGRRACMSSDGETAAYLPISPTGYNRASVITNYDPYNAPGGMMETGVLSEAHNLDWRHHIHWVQALPELRAMADAIGGEAFAEQEAVPV